MLTHLQPLIPPTSAVMVLGDGEFDGTALQALLQQFHWQYICRTAPNLVMTVYGRDHRIGALAPMRGELPAVRPAWIQRNPMGRSVF